MCGITGIWHYQSNRPVERERLQSITDIIAHRGPDGEGFYWGPGPGLGHRRLSIIDLEGGKQPLCNEDGSVWIVFNGEIYNYPELREEILARGHVLKTHSDTESIVHLYEDYGEKCFEKLRGMFAIALWDQRNQRLLLGRDRLGIKPLFYGLGKDAVVFGSELKSIRESGLVPLDIEPTAIADLFTYFYIPGPKTIYKSVQMLEPGYYAVVTRDGIRKQPYWDLQAGELQLASEKAYEDRLYAELTDAVRSHLLSDVPVGAFLSGGVDSSTVVGIMAGLVSEPVMTCSMGFDVEEFNELPRARQIAGRFHTDHHEQVVTPEPAKVLQKLTEHYDQPFPDHSSVPTFYVSALARKRVKVVLSGDGGDENFGGYSRYARLLSLQKIRDRVPRALLAPFAAGKGDRFNGGLNERLRRVLRQIAIGSPEDYLHAMTIADGALCSRLFSSDLREELRGYDPLDVFRDIYRRAPGDDPLTRIFYLDLKTYLVDDILTKVDRASMANSLEVRVPILDHKIVEFAFSLPLALKLRNGEKKYLLRKAASRIIPADFLAAPKQGFRIPATEWMRGGLRPWVEEHVIAPATRDAYLNAAGIASIWGAFQQGGSNLSDVLSILLSFELSRPVWSKSAEAALQTT